MQNWFKDDKYIFIKIASSYVCRHWNNNQKKETIFFHVKMIQLWAFRYLNFWMIFSAILSNYYMTLNEMKWNKLNDLREKLRMCWEIKAGKISGSMPLQVTTVSMKILSHSFFRKWNWISLFCVCLCTLCFFHLQKKVVRKLLPLFSCVISVFNVSNQEENNNTKRKKKLNIKCVKNNYEKPP